MEKGIVRADGQAGIKMFSSPKKIGGQSYNYELKTTPHSKYGNHRLYGNLETWTEQNGVRHQSIVFRYWDKSAH